MRINVGIYPQRIDYSERKKSSWGWVILNEQRWVNSSERYRHDHSCSIEVLNRMGADVEGPSMTSAKRAAIATVR